MAQPVRSDPEEEHRVELALAMLLRAGVVLAAVLVLIGGLMYLAQEGGLHPDYARFSGEPGTLQHPFTVFAAALALQPLGLIQLGVLVLLATPVVRVGFSLLAFARERDRTYVGMTAVVLVVLLLSLLGVLP
jgi:uncharacterized membrane protein